MGVLSFWIVKKLLYLSHPMSMIYIRIFCTGHRVAWIVSTIKSTAKISGAEATVIPGRRQVYKKTDDSADANLESFQRKSRGQFLDDVFRHGRNLAQGTAVDEFLGG